MRAVLTGGTGYIGGNLMRRLLDDGWDVCAIVRPESSAALPAKVVRVEDTGDAAALASSLAPFQPDTLFHLAAAQPLDDAAHSSDLLVASNIAFGARVLAACRSAGVTSCAAASTYAVHADGTTDYAPQTLYAATKQAFADIAAHYRRNTGLQTVMLELSDTYGANDPRSKFLELVAEAARTQSTLEATTGEQVVRPLHVNDVADAFVFAARALAEGGRLDGAHTVCGDEAVTLRELVAAFESATGIHVPVAWGALPYRRNEILQPYAGDRLPGWKPRVSLAEGLSTVYASPASA